jgi:hypothetical protein
VASAARWVLIVGILFAMSGTYFGFQMQQAAKEARQGLAAWEDEDFIRLEDGTESTVGELRAAIDDQVLFAFGINYLLAAIMVGLFIWARRAAFPAILTAFCVYVVVQVGNAMVDPSTIGKGLLLKGIVIIILLAGLRAALVESAARRHAEMEGGGPAEPA